MENIKLLKSVYRSYGKLLEILKMSMNKQELVDSVEAYKRRWLAKNPMHMIVRSPFAPLANSQTKRKIGTEQKKL